MSSAMAAYSATSSEHESYFFTATSLKPLLQFITTECVASLPIRASGPGLVDFVLQLLAANKEQLYQMCGRSRGADAAAAA